MRLAPDSGFSFMDGKDISQRSDLTVAALRQRRGACDQSEARANKVPDSPPRGGKNLINAHPDGGLTGCAVLKQRRNT
jgi:hypothetical protein